MDKVIPRDLFNDSNLLFTYGKLYIQLKKFGLEKNLVEIPNPLDDSFEDFNIRTDTNSGSTSIKNIELITNNQEFILLFRPLNSKDKNSLFFNFLDYTEDLVFLDEECEEINSKLIEIIIGETNE